jgi:hypothetical protein
MSWQDLVYGIGNVLFAVALIPSIRSSDKPHIRTSILNACVLVFFVIAGISLELYFTAVVTAVVVGLWALLAIQKYNGAKGR